MIEQARGLRSNPSLMLVDDSDKPAKWYFRAEAGAAEGDGGASAERPGDAAVAELGGPRTFCTKSQSLHSRYFRSGHLRQVRTLARRVQDDQPVNLCFHSIGSCGVNGQRESPVSARVFAVWGLDTDLRVQAVGRFREGKAAMICWVSSETVMTWPMRRRMYLRVVLAVGVVDDAGAFVGGDLVLVDDPLERGAIAEAVVEGGGRDAVEGEEVVVDEAGLVFRELHCG